MKSAVQIQQASVASDEAVRKHICIDLEGEGRRADGSTPHPSLLGALVPDADGKGKHYRLWLLEPELAPMAKSPRIPGRVEHRAVSTLETAIIELVELAELRGCRLVAFTEHELRVVRAHLPESSPARQAFERLYFNVQPPARRLANRRRLKFEEASLEGLMGVLAPGFSFPARPQPDVAEACRRLRKAGVRSRRWGNWAERHQSLAMDLVAYNRGDCVAVWKLVNRVAASLR